MLISFSMQLSEAKSKEFEEWKIEQDDKVAYMQKDSQFAKQGFLLPYYGACGGAYNYTFTPTSLGTCLVVEHIMTKEKINLTDFDEW